MGAHAMDFENMKSPVGFAGEALKFIFWGTIGCMVGHAFMVPINGFEISGQVGVALDNLFSPVTDLFNNAATSDLSAYNYNPDSIATFAETPSTAFPPASTALPDTQTGFFTYGDPDFFECVQNGGTTHPHGADLVCHPP